MSATRSGPLELAKAVGREARELAGMLRRMIVTRTSSALWQVLGHDLGHIGGDVETRDAEMFGGVGFYARPSSSGDVEAIVAFPAGGRAAPVIISIRQESVRQDVAGDLAEDETQIHNTEVRIRIKANGTVEICTHGGDPQPLPTLATLEALRDAILGWVPVGTDGGAALKVALTELFTGPPAWPVGTTVLKAE